MSKNGAAVCPPLAHQDITLSLSPRGDWPSFKLETDRDIEGGTNGGPS